MNKLFKPVIITGIKHCGKSSTGRIVSDLLSCDFQDTDALAEDIFFREIGEKLSSREIFRRSHDLFLSFELKAAAELSLTKTPLIAAAGGGICDNAAAVAKLINSFVFVYIEEDVRVLYKRIITGGIPSFLSPDKPFDDFIKLYKTRTAKYDMISDIKITAQQRTAEAISRVMIQKLMEEGYAG